MNRTTNTSRMHPYARSQKKTSYKYNRKQNVEEDSPEESPLQTPNPLNPKQLFNPFKTMFGNDDTDVYAEDNHIYFKTDVDVDSINKLCKLIREYQSKLYSLKTNVKIGKLEPAPLFIHITSYGGDLYQGFLGYDYIKSSPLVIHTVVEGYAASAGTLLSIAGKMRYITPTSIMLIHQLSTGMHGKFSEIEDDYQNSKQDMTRICDLYYNSCLKKMTKTEIREHLKHDKWFDAKKCIKLGLCDEIYSF
jgi:ATP-dependent protease ClpP protease subunit